MAQEHPDEDFALTAEERFRFRQIWKDLADEEAGVPGPDGAALSAWPFVMVGCVLLVFLGLAVDSAFLVLLAAAGAFGARVARRRHPR